MRGYFSYLPPLHFRFLPVSERLLPAFCDPAGHHTVMIIPPTRPVNGPFPPPCARLPQPTDQREPPPVPERERPGAPCQGYLRVAVAAWIYLSCMDSYSVCRAVFESVARGSVQGEGSLPCLLSLRCPTWEDRASRLLSFKMNL